MIDTFHSGGTTMKRLLALILALAMLFALAACGKNESPSGSTAPTDAPPELSELFKRSSYTADDSQLSAARDTVVATFGDVTLTNSMLQIYYWMDAYNFISSYSSKLSQYGLDIKKPLDQQDCLLSSGTWQHYFLSNSLKSWHYYQALALMADETQTPINPSMQEALDNLYDDLEKNAKEEKFDSIDALIQADAGAGCTAQDYYKYTELLYKGYSYFDKIVAGITITDAMIEEFFTEHEEELKESGISKESGNAYHVRHILIRVDDGKTDADWESCKKEAQKIMDEWLAGEATEAAFAELASKHSEDTGSNYNGGLFEGLSDDTNFVKEFKDWYLDNSRKVGDYGLVKSDYGYHIMYFSGSEIEWIYQCREAAKAEKTSEAIQAAMDKYTVTVEYDKILLPDLKFS
jgi:hypothetical protein